MAAAFVCNMLNLPTDFNNHAAYISEWTKKLKSDRREIFHVAADAQRIADWTLAYHPDFTAKQLPTRPGAPQAEPDALMV